MRQTGERVDPESARTVEEQVTAALHTYAYLIAREHALNARRLLDIGFGEGYGAAVVGPVVDEYVGVEISDEAVEHARARYGSGTTSFLTYDGTTLPFSEDSFDIAVSFQVVEHVADPVGFLREARRVVRAGGRVLVTTPNRAHRVFDGERPWNRFHVREFNSQELSQVMNEVFSTVELYGVCGTPLVEGIERSRVSRARRRARLDPLGLRYVLPESLARRLRAVFMGVRRPSLDDRPAVGADQISSTSDGVEGSLDLLAVGYV